MAAERIFYGVVEAGGTKFVCAIDRSQGFGTTTDMARCPSRDTGRLGLAASESA
jgi:hypothetical protein